MVWEFRVEPLLLRCAAFVLIASRLPAGSSRNFQGSADSIRQNKPTRETGALNTHATTIPALEQAIGVLHTPRYEFSDSDGDPARRTPLHTRLALAGAIVLLLRARRHTRLAGPGTHQAKTKRCPTTPGVLPAEYMTWIKG